MFPYSRRLFFHREGAPLSLLGIKTHARMAIGGIPAYRTGMETLKEYFGEA